MKKLLGFLLLLLLGVYGCHPVGGWISGQDNERDPEDIRIPVLMYHDFDSDPQTSATITPDMFEKHLAYLHESGFEPIDLTTLSAFLHEGTTDDLPEKPVVITIDDGYPNTYNKALPLLESYGFPSTLFLYTNRVAEEADNDEFLSWDELQDMEERGMRVESHSVTHDRFMEKKDDESHEEWEKRIRKEFTKSKALIEEHLDKEVNYFAYPYGDFNEEIETFGIDAGYELMFTVREHYVTYDTDPMRIYRFAILREMNLEDFKDIMNEDLDPEDLYREDDVMDEGSDKG